MFWVDKQPVYPSRFPDGECNLSRFERLSPWASSGSERISLEPRQGYPTATTLTMKWESDADLITLMLLRRRYPNLTNLNILFLPYSREDRDAAGQSGCSLRYIGEFIQSLGFKSITITDPHSDLSLAYLGETAKSHYPFSPFAIMDELGETQESVVILFPDAGAQKRYGKIWGDFDQMVGFKNRDFHTGKITSYELAGGSKATGKTVLIVDDLCSYGGTFMAAGNALTEFDPKKVVLLVTHCEDSITKGHVFDIDSPIGHVITTDSLLTAYGPGQHQLPYSRLTVIELPK